MLSLNIRSQLIHTFTEQELQDYAGLILRYDEEWSKGAHLEKLQSKGSVNLLSLRVNKKIRLILRRLEGEDGLMWHLEDVLLKHNYSVLLKKYKHDNLRQIDYIKWVLKPSELPSFDLEPHEMTAMDNALWYRGVPIYLSDSQIAAKFALLPLILSGAPGCGKSSTALKILIDAVKAIPEDEVYNQRFLYITSTIKLAQFMREIFINAQKMDDSLTGCQIDFETPETIYKKHHQAALSKLEGKEQEDPPEEKNNHLAGMEHFSKWITQCLKQKSKQEKIKGKSSKITPNQLPFQEPSDIYQEFRSLSGYASFEEYNNQVGNKRSLYSKKEERECVYEVYQNYQTHLKNLSLVDLSFYEFMNETFDLIVADEAQDFSNFQIKNLVEHAKESKIVICSGDHQQHFGSESLIPYVGYLYKKANHSKKARAITHHRLHETYRCSQAIVDFAAFILRCKAHAIGGVEEFGKYQFKNMAGSCKKEPGTVLLINKIQLEQLEKQNSEADGNADFAVVTVPEYLKEAQDKFGIGAVFTAQEVKGLGYETILLYRILESKLYKEMDPLFDDSFKPVDDAFSGSVRGSIRNSAHFNRLFIASTRAEERLYIYQPESNLLARRLFSALKVFLTKEKKNQVGLFIVPESSSKARWEQRIEELKEQGFSGHAEAIQNKLNKIPQGVSSEKSTVHREVPRKKTSKPVKKAVSKDDQATHFLSRYINGDASVLRNILLHKDGIDLIFNRTLPYQHGSGSMPTIFLVALDSPEIRKKLIEALVNIFAEKQLSSTFISLLFYKHKQIPVFPSSLFGLFFKDLLSLEKLIVLEKKFKVFHHSKLLQLEVNCWFYDQNEKEECRFTSKSILSGNISYLKILFGLGLNLDIPISRDGTRLIHAIASNGRIELVQAFCELGADITTPDESTGWTPLYAALATLRKDTISMLIQYGVDINQKTKGYTAAHLVAKEADDRVNMMKMLHEFKADFSVKDNSGNTPLYFAVIVKNIKIIDFLLECGCLEHFEVVLSFSELFTIYNQENKSGFYSFMECFNHSIDEKEPHDLQLFCVSSKQIAALREFSNLNAYPNSLSSLGFFGKEEQPCGSSQKSAQNEFQEDNPNESESIISDKLAM